MTGGLLLGQFSVLAIAMLTLIAALACALFYPRVRHAIAALDPPHRARILLLLSVAPALAGLLLTAICFLPSLASTVWASADHCPDHAAGHAHLCLTHLPAAGHGALAWVLVCAAVLGLAAILVRRSVDIVRSGRLLDRLVGASHYDEALGVWVAQSRYPIALTAGLLRNRIVVSSGLLQELPAELVDALLAHERCHARRRDPLRKLVARVASAAHLPATRRRLLDDLALATEQTCDEAAGAATGDRLLVAQAMLAVERLAQREPRGADIELGVAAEYFGRVPVTPRVEALLTTRCRRSSPWLIWGPLLATFVLALLVASPIHHATETLLGLIAR